MPLQFCPLTKFFASKMDQYNFTILFRFRIHSKLFNLSSTYKKLNKFTFWKTFNLYNYCKRYTYLCKQNKNTNETQNIKLPLLIYESTLSLHSSMIMFTLLDNNNKLWPNNGRASCIVAQLSTHSYPTSLYLFISLQ